MTIVLDSFADAVDENYDASADGYDGDAVLTPSGLRSRLPPPPRFLASALDVTAQSVVVPFVSGIGQGDVGDDVYAIKRAFSRAQGGGRLRKLMSKPLAVRRTWGRDFSQELGALVYSQRLHQKYAPFFDDLALQLWHTANVVDARERIIQSQLAWHTALFNRRFNVGYSQARPSQLVAASRITRADCSGSVAGGCAWAKILPKVDWRYTNTWVQQSFGSPVSTIVAALPGDVILYGSPSHEALYLGDSLVWSFGSYPIKILRFDYRHDRHSIRRFVP